MTADVSTDAPALLLAQTFTAGAGGMLATRGLVMELAATLSERIMEHLIQQCHAKRKPELMLYLQRALLHRHSQTHAAQLLAKLHGDTDEVFEFILAVLTDAARLMKSGATLIAYPAHFPLQTPLYSTSTRAVLANFGVQERDIQKLEDAGTSAMYSPMTVLTNFGIQKCDIQKLEEAGILTPEEVLRMTRRKLEAAMGVSTAKAEKLREAALHVVKRPTFPTAIDQAERDVNFCFVRAARIGELNVVQSLLDAGISVDVVDVGGTALCEASEYAQPEMVELLLERGARIDAAGAAHGRAPLAAACTTVFNMEDRESVVHLLLAGGAPTEQRDGDGRALSEVLEWFKAVATERDEFEALSRFEALEVLLNEARYAPDGAGYCVAHAEFLHTRAQQPT